MFLEETKAIILVVFMILVMDSSCIKSKGEDTCVSGYCLDPTYNKLELPSSKPSHVRINLEVTSRVKKISNSFSVITQNLTMVIICSNTH